MITKGILFCDGLTCLECPIISVCSNEVIDRYDTIELVEQWGKEHPIETNGSRFLKNYLKADLCGYEDGGYILHIGLDSSKPANIDNNMIKIPMSWWESEVDG